MWTNYSPSQIIVNWGDHKTNEPSAKTWEIDWRSEITIWIEEESSYKLISNRKSKFNRKRQIEHFT